MNPINIGPGGEFSLEGENFVIDELADELDLVVDDASPAYEETKASFEFLFPLVSPGGV